MRFLPHLLSLVLFVGIATEVNAELRIGIVGLDSSHAMDFTRILNDANAKDHVPGARVTGVHITFSPDMSISASKVEGYTERMQRDHGMRFYATIEELAKNVDGVMIQSKDGRAHLAQARAVILAGKPLFIDKPFAASLRDVLEIFRLGREHRVPVFSSSSLRFATGTQAVRSGSIGKVRTAEAYSITYLEPHHPDLFYYGIHGVESLFTVMGEGIEKVKRKNSTVGSIEVEGGWKDGRSGTFREGKGYGGKAVGEKGEAKLGRFEGYAPLVAEIVKFFQTGIPPVPEQETIEIYAFMQADELSKSRGGAEVTIAEVFQVAGSATSDR